MIKAIIRHFRMKAYREEVEYLDQVVSRQIGNHGGLSDKSLKAIYYRELSILNTKYGVTQ